MPYYWLIFLFIIVCCFTACKPEDSPNDKKLVEQFDRTLVSIGAERDELAKKGRKWDQEERRLQKRVAQGLEALPPKERERIESGIRSGTFSVENELDPAVVTVATHLDELLLIQSNNSRLKEQLRAFDLQIERAKSEKFKIEKRIEARALLEKDKNNAECNLTALASLSDEAISEEGKRVVRDPTAKTPTADDRCKALDEAIVMRDNSRKQLLQTIQMTGLLVGGVALLFLIVAGLISENTYLDIDWLCWTLLALSVASFAGSSVSCCVLNGNDVEMKEISDSVNKEDSPKLKPRFCVKAPKPETVTKDDSKKTNVPIPAGSSDAKSSAPAEKSAKPIEKTEAKKTAVGKASAKGGSSKPKTDDSKKANVPIPASTSDAKSSAPAENGAKPIEKTEAKQIAVDKASAKGGSSKPKTDDSKKANVPIPASTSDAKSSAPAENGAKPTGKNTSVDKAPKGGDSKIDNASDIAAEASKIERF